MPILISIFYSFVENFVSNTHFNDLNVNLEKFTFTELVKVIKKLKDDSSPGEDGIHNRFIRTFLRNDLKLF